MKMCLTVSSSGKEMIYSETLTLLPAQHIEMLYLPSAPRLHPPSCVFHTPAEREVVLTALRPLVLGGRHSGTQTPLGTIRPGLRLHVVRESGYDSVCWQSHLNSCHDTVRCTRTLGSSKCCGPTVSPRSVLEMKNLRSFSRLTEAKSSF